MPRSGKRECIPLAAPTEVDVNATIDKLRRMYSESYGWEAPKPEGRAGGGGIQARMRYKVQASINARDLLRFYPESRPDILTSGGGEPSGFCFTRLDRRDRSLGP